MKLLIIRHGESEGDVLDLHEGSADFSLSDSGAREAEALAAWIKENYSIDKIFTSPLRRAFETARALENASALGKACGVEVVQEDGLKEFDNGLLAGHSRSAADRLFPEVKVGPEESAYGMESQVQFRQRAEAVLEKIALGCRESECVAVVSHGKMINQMLKVLLGLGLEDEKVFVTGDTGVHELEVSFDEQGLFCNARLVVENSTAHIGSEFKAELDSRPEVRTAYFAGGCFWCITPIFKMYKARKVLCGYSGGDEVNPVYEDVKKQKTGHRETIAVVYDPETVSYSKLLDIFIANVDPYDSEGQFIDKGFSYTLAVYYTCSEEKEIALQKIKALEEKSGKKVYIALEEFKNFYEAETYHQDFAEKNPEAFEKELIESGRKSR